MSKKKNVLFSAVYVYICICVYVYVYVYVFVYVNVFVCLYVCVKCVWKDGERTVSRAKSGETLLEAPRDANAQIFRKTFFMGAKDKSNHLTAGSLQRFSTITVA